MPTYKDHSADERYTRPGIGQPGINTAADLRAWKRYLRLLENMPEPIRAVFDPPDPPGLMSVEEIRKYERGTDGNLIMPQTK